MASDYATNTAFMTQQITKLTASNDAKNAEIKKLQDQLYETKQHYENEIKEIFTLQTQFFTIVSSPLHLWGVPEFQNCKVGWGGQK